MKYAIFQFPIDPKTRHKRLEKYYPKDKFDKSTCRICSIYFNMAAFVDNIKFPLSNLNINNLILINFHISLKTKRIVSLFWPEKNVWLTCRKNILNELALTRLSSLFLSSFSFFLSIWSFWSLKKIFYPL